jgi:hypothetical protein
VETSSTVRAARRPALVAVVAVVAIAALVLAISSRDGGPPVIRLGAEGAGAEMTTLEDAAQEDAATRLAYVEYRFVLTDGARFDAGESMAWRLEPPTDLRASATNLAAQLGIDDGPVESPHGDGSVLVGPDDGSAPSLWVGPSGDWFYSAPSLLAHDACAELTPQQADRARDLAEDPELQPTDPPADEAAAGEPTSEPVEVEPDVLIEDAGAGSEPSVGVDACEPVPPVGIPDEAGARTAAEAFFGDVGLGAAPIITEASADEWGAWVSASLPVDGQPTDVFLSVAFGPEAAVTSASGTLARLVEVDRYPTVDAETAVARLQEEHTFRGDGVQVLIDPAVDPDTPVESPATDEAATDEAATDEEVSILPAPEPQGEPEVVTVTLVEAEPFALLTWDADQTVWLLPGVRFGDDQGGTWQILTVADEYLVAPADIVDGAVPEPAPEPLPEPAPDGLDPGEAQTVAEGLVGSTEEEAVATVEAAGFVARVIARDGEDLAVTDDYRVDRINLRIEGGVVTGAGVG